MNATRWVWAISVFVFVGYASAQEKKDAEELAVVEIGATPSRNLKDHTSSLGPTVAIEVSPIERWLELEAGVTSSFGRDAGASTNSVAREAVLDFMFWPVRWKHKFGWYVEPSYEYNFRRGHERSIGVSFGLLVAIRKH